MASDTDLHKSKNYSKLTGYVRADKRVGFRNHIVIIPTTGCVQSIATKIAEKITGTVLFFQPFGCDLLGPDQDQFGEMLYQLSTGPNVGGAVFVTMGCATTNVHRFPARTAETGRSVRVINTQQTGGTSDCIAAGIKAVQEITRELEPQKRCEVPVSSIVMGTKCGSSDESSFEICHPIMGICCDMLVDMGAAVVLSEEFEFYEATDSLADRAVDEATAAELYAIKHRLKNDMQNRCGITPEEISGSLDNPEKARQQSLGHIKKAGTRAVQKVIGRGKLIGEEKGLLVLDAASSDVITLTSLTAAGCNIIVFTTGHGTLIASPTAPTIKITANEKTFNKMNENMDILVKTKDNAKELLELIIAVANGKPTKAELAGHGEMFMSIEGATF